MKKTKLWKYIEEHMRAAGLNQTRLANKSGVATSGMSYLRHNTAVPGDAILQRISNVLEIDIKELKRLRNIVATQWKKAGRELRTNFCRCQDNDKVAGDTNYQTAIENIRQNEILLANEELEDYRVCLKCGKKFQSEGPWNRICIQCHTANEGRIQPARTYKIMESGKLAD